MSRKFLSVNQFAERYEAFRLPTLRYLLYHRHENGLSPAVIQVGRRIFIDEDLFFAWVESQAAANAARTHA